jgi:hypothetical protein
MVLSALPAGCGWLSSNDAPSNDAQADAAQRPASATATAAGAGAGPNASLETLVAQSARDIETLRDQRGTATPASAPTNTPSADSNTADSSTADSSTAARAAGAEAAAGTLTDPSATGIRVERGNAPQPTRVTSLAADADPANSTNPTSSVSTPDAGAGSASDPSASNPASAVASVSEAAPVKGVDARVSEHVEALAKALRERAQGSTHPLADYAAAAALESLKPGLMADAEAPSSPIWSSLSPSERATLSSVRVAAAGLARLREADADPAQFERDLERARAPFSSSAGVTIARASLASRVEGFGRDVPFASTTFVAGRPTRAILYVEMGRFGHRPARASDPGFAALSQSPAGGRGEGEPVAYAVELTQELALFNATDSTAVWTRPEQTVTDVSRNKRRDFFLVREIELPANLSVGSYTLRVTVRDRSASGAEAAETSIPITIVAERASR